MVKEWPQTDGPSHAHREDQRSGDAWHEVDLNDLLGCCRRELALRQRVYPKWVAKGTMSEKKAEKEIELMRAVVDFLVHCVFKAVTRRAKESSSD